MKTKLTLTLNKEIIDRAKIYAKEHGTSLSKMVGAYFQNIVYISDEKSDEIETRVRNIVGRIKLPPDFDFEKAKEEYHREKYGM